MQQITAEANKYQAIIQPYLSGEKTSCSYCDYLAPLVLLEGKHTYITLVIGQYTEGYLQLCSKLHKTSTAGLSSEELEEYFLMKQIIREAYRQAYGTPGIFFEHGKAGTCLWRSEDENKYSLCHHCHLHCVPKPVDIREAIKVYLPNELIVHNLEELRTIRKEILMEYPYLYFEDTQEIGYVYPVSNTTIPRQFLRTCVAEQLDIPEKGDWITFPGTEFFDKTRTTLEPLLNKLYKEKLANQS